VAGRSSVIARSFFYERLRDGIGAANVFFAGPMPGSPRLNTCDRATLCGSTVRDGGSQLLA